MDKKQLVDRVADRWAWITKADAKRVIDGTIREIRDSVVRGDAVTLVGFGTFHRERRRARVARNPRHPEQEIKVPQRDVPSFDPHASFVSMVATQKAKPTKMPAHSPSTLKGLKKRKSK